MLAIVPLLLMVLFSFIGCAPSFIEEASLPGPGSHFFSLETDGQERQYLMHLPPDASHNRQLPLVVVFHGYASSARRMERITGMSEKADREGFIAVYPQATGFIRTAWNADFCCGDAYLQGVDDLQFFRDLIETLKRNLHIDDSRIFVAGFSNGGMMAYDLAAQMPDVIAAIALVSAAAGIRPAESPHALTIPEPLAPVPLIGFHGLKDAHIPYHGGEGKRTKDVLKFFSVDQSLAFWLRANQCGSEPIRESISGGRVFRDRYLCGKADVIFYSIIDGDHTWPVDEDLYGPGSGSGISATDAMWEFFLAHPNKI